MKTQSTKPELMIFDTLTKSSKCFVPNKEDEITMYHCGPTVYWTQHIGNMRAMVMADLVRRSLAFLYPESIIKFARNYTDVGHLTSDEDNGEDKMEKGAKREGVTPQDIAKKYTKQFMDDIGQMNCLEIDSDTKHHKKNYPAATEYIGSMRSMVQTLLDNGYAYITPLAIYFDISKKSDYTKLSRQDMSKLINDAGHGDIMDGDKRNKGDFSLWFFRAGVHAYAVQHWASDFVFTDYVFSESQERGFPGWHIECSAMIRDVLGQSIDIHMGGIEHIPIHHTNEIAQSESFNQCCHDNQPFVNYWLHNEHLNVNDKKMSKSEGTSFVLKDITDKGFSPMDLRFFFLQAHYRSKQNFRWDVLESAKISRERLVRNLRIVIGQYTGVLLPENQEFYEYQKNKELVDRITGYVCDDFNMSGVLSVLYTLVSTCRDSNSLEIIRSVDRLLGCNLWSDASKSEESEEIPAEIKELALERSREKAVKNWEGADKLRDQIALLGYEVLDTADGYTIKKAIQVLFTYKEMPSRNN